MSSAHDNSPVSTVPDILDPPMDDPPPPYRDPWRRHHHHTRTTRSHPIPSDSHFDTEYSDDEDGPDTSESTPFLLSTRGHAQRHSRQRSFSHGSNTTSSATSLTQTVVSLIYGDDDDQTDCFCAGLCADPSGHHHQLQQAGVGVDDSHFPTVRNANLAKYFFNSPAWKKYFVPLGRKVYYNALFHLLVINFPYALLAWIYLFVFTVTGTTTLVALPLGAILCFLDLLGARAFSRGELYLQIRFHQVHISSYQPRPLFTRLREPSSESLESGRVRTRFHLVKEHSFYKNTYAMFTDSTSYQALFYFLVIKPAITLLITLYLLVIGIPSLILVLPAPILLRTVKKIGIWQANIAIEGLYRAVR